MTCGIQAFSLLSRRNREPSPSRIDEGAPTCAAPGDPLSPPILFAFGVAAALPVCKFRRKPLSLRNLPRPKHNILFSLFSSAGP
ncbi:hypothetical protein Trydic_g15830 [Trypoxylus dichotomus]